MLNAMPLPIGPTESVNAIAKPEMNRKVPDKAVTGEDATSFASTLESVHKKNQPMRDDQYADGDATSDAQSVSEGDDVDVVPGIKDRVSSVDDVFALVAQEPTAPNNDLDLEIAVSDFEANTAVAETPPASESDSIEDMVGAQEKTVTSLHRNPLDFVVSRQSAVTNATPQEGGDGHGDSAEPLLQEGANTLKTVGQAAGEAGKSAMGAKGSESVVDQSHQASQIMEGAPDRKMTQKAHQNSLDGLMKQDVKVDDTPIKPVFEEGQSQLSSKENPAPHLQHKGIETPKIDGETSTPGKFKADVLDFQTIRSQKTDDTTEAPKTFGDRVPETPINMTNDETSPMTGRQGGFDPMPSFSTLPSDGKGVLASGHTNAAPVAMENFQQENFHQLVERALFTVRGEQSEARIALKPDHLGHVQMKIVTENNIVTVKIITETPVARDLIDANANQLKAELQHQGLTVEDIEVSVSDERHDAYRQARQRESFMRHMASRENGSSDEDSEIPGNGPAKREFDRNRVAGIDYFA
jgi:flagellar hook-length control protein FliK